MSGEIEMNCRGCGAKMEERESYDHNGRKLCEDCYMDALAPAKTCDPWASYTAGRLEAKEEDLSPDQRKLLDLLEKGPAEVEQILEELKMDRPVLERAVATLRHMNRVRAFPSGGRKHLILYHQVNPDWAES